MTPSSPSPSERNCLLLRSRTFPYPGIGHIRAEADGGYTFVPIDYRDRDGH